MMTRMIRFGLAVLVLLLGMTSWLAAAEVNKRNRLAPEQQVKVNNVLARSYVYQNGAGADTTTPRTEPTPCGTTQLAPTQQKSRATRSESTFVSRGDVIVVNRNVRCR